MLRAGENFSLVPMADGAKSEILAWIDGEEDYPTNKELRADGGTPLAGSLEDAREYFRTEDLPIDADRGCRYRFVVALTDGEESCGGNAVAAAQQLRDTAYDSSSYDIKTFVVGLGRTVEGSQILDGMARAGGTAVDLAGQPDLTNGHAYFASDIVSLTAILEDIVAMAERNGLCR